MPALPLQPDIRECEDFGTRFFNPIDCSRAVLDRAGERVREEIREEISQAASSAASNALTELAQAVNEGVHQLLKIMVAWITDVEAVDLTSGSAATTIDQMGYLLSPVVLLVGVVGLLVAAGRMVLTRKADPLVPLGGGVLVVVIVQALGVGVANLLLRAGDAWSVWVLNSTMTEQLEDRLILVMTFGQYDGSGPVSEDGATQAGLTVSALLVILLRDHRAHRHGDPDDSDDLPRGGDHHLGCPAAVGSCGHDDAGHPKLAAACEQLDAGSDFL